MGASWERLGCEKTLKRNLTRHGTGSAVLLLRISFCSDAFCCFALCLLVFCNYFFAFGGRFACFSSAPLASLAALARSLRAPCHFKAIVLRLVSVWGRKLKPKSFDNPPKSAPKSIQNRIQIDLGSVLATELHFSSILVASWAAPGASWRVLGAKLEASWPPKGYPKPSKIDPKILQKLDASWTPLGIDFSLILTSKIDPSWSQNP